MPDGPSVGHRWWIAGLALALIVPALVAQAPGGSLPFVASQQAADASSVDRTIEVDVVATDCPEGYDNQVDDDVCLAYDGQIPGPTFVFEEGQRVELTLNHSVDATVDDTAAGPELADKLTNLRYTLHRHGVSVDACEDGVAQPTGTEVCDSSVGPASSDLEPNGSVTYTFETAFPGYWHYHDHSLGLGVGTTHGEHAGPEAEHRGLWGAFRVLPSGASTDHVFDLHLLDTGPNGGLGLMETVQAGDTFDFIATGLGDFGWRVSLEDPSGETIWTGELGPGVTRGITVEDAEQGSYQWTAQTPRIPGQTFTGEVVAS